MTQSPSVLRTDIEGLRAISVIAVVLYHAHVPGFGGGFVGVDVFFVISGFLITGQLLREFLARGTIDALSFWARRCRRLFPNALAVLTATAIASALILPMMSQPPVGYDIAAAVLEIANYRFASRALDYFDHAGAASPVLHFWSLSIEEQFYIALPLLLLLASLLPTRFKTRATCIGAFAAIAIASFACALYWIGKSQPFAFFHTEARVWQLACGGLLALASMPARDANRDDRLSRWIEFAARPVTGWAGLVGIAGCIALYHDRLGYPGLWALIPTLSAVLLIASQSAQTGAGSLLSHPLLQWIGARSYSLYLWHWPILVLAPSILPESWPAAPIVLPLIVAVSAAAYRGIETPLRAAHGVTINTKRTLATAVAACVAVVGVCLGATNARLWQSPEIAAIAARVAAARIDGPRTGGEVCQLGWGETAHPPCVFGAKGAARSVVLFGDSHAAHLFDGLNEAALLEQWSLKFWTKGGCPPIAFTHFNTDTRTRDDACAAWREIMLQRMIAEKPQLVVIASWAGLAVRMADPATGKMMGSAQSLEIWSRGFQTVLERLTRAGIKVAVVRATPRTRRSDDAACLIQHGFSACGTPRHRAIDDRSPDAVVALRVAGVTLLDLTDHFCTTGFCPAQKDGALVYRDGTHITATFSKTLAPAFRAVLAAR